MDKKILTVGLGIATLLTCTALRADDLSAKSDNSTRFDWDGGLSFGGDTIGTVQYTNGNSTTLHYGDSLFADIGFRQPLGSSDWSFKGTLGYGFIGAFAKNGNVTFSYFPVDLLAIYSIGDHHMGVGATYHASPSLDQSSFGPTINYDGAWGWMVQYQYRFIGIRYTKISYTPSNGPIVNQQGQIVNSADGSNVALFFNWSFL